MKILAPVTSAREATVLIAKGAGELYCGVNPTLWSQNYGKTIWLNRRGPGKANINSLKELVKLTGVAHKQDVPVFLALNQPLYPPEQYPVILSLVKEVEECGIDAFILGDPGLMMAIKEELPRAVIHVSSLASVLNSASATFFKNLGVSRVIFPRYVDLEEIRAITNKVGPQVEYEVFILNDGCSFEEGFCHVSHAFGGAICHTPWSYKLINTQKENEPAGKEPFKKHLRDYQEWLWYIRNCNGGSGPKGYPLGMCGLCALPELDSLGVQSLKIVGREAPLEKKIASVNLVRKILNYVEAGESRERVKNKAREIRATPELCSGYMCYYR